jgi:hypothetical protein
MKRYRSTNLLSPGRARGRVFKIAWARAEAHEGDRALKMSLVGGRVSDFSEQGQSDPPATVAVGSTVHPPISGPLI